MIFQLRGLMVNIRKPEIEDVACIARWLSSDAYINNFSRRHGMKLSFYTEQAEEMLQSNANDFSPSKCFLIEDRFSGLPVALATLCKIDFRNRHAEYAYIIGESHYREKMIAGDLNIILYNHFFNNLNLNKVYGFVVSGNISSYRIHDFGGSHDGTLKMHRFTESSLAADVDIFSITKTEFSVFIKKYANTLLKKHIDRGLIECTVL